MGRTRTAVLDGAARAVEKHGSRKATMADIAALAGVAKGTLYNHFRDKDAVYAAAIDAGIRSLTEDAVATAAEDLGGALAETAERLGAHPALRRIAAEEPAVLACLTTPGDTTVWGLVRSGVRDTLVSGQAGAGSADVDLVLRWLVSAVAAPMVEPAAQAARLAGCLAADASERPTDPAVAGDAGQGRQRESAPGDELVERTGAIEPEVAEPDVAETHVAETHVAETHVAEPDVAEPEVRESGVVEPGVTGLF